jgi:hypothetical protein
LTIEKIKVIEAELQAALNTLKQKTNSVALSPQANYTD